MNSDTLATQTTGQMIFVLLHISEIAATDLMLPKNNFSGARILCLLLDAKLEAAGQLLLPVSFIGQLNHGCAICTVRDAHESARIVRETLEQAALSPLARIWRLDEDEIIYRNLFPTPGQDIQLEEFRRLLEAIEALSAPALAQIKEFVRLNQPKSDGQPEAPESPANPS